jgi:cytochrome P450
MMAFHPPAPRPRSNLVTGLKILLGRSPDLLETLPRDCYRKPVVSVPVGKRPVLIVNDPEFIKHIFIDALGIYPKSDLMISALSPLVGDGVLISNGEQWAHDRKMLDPAFMHMRLAEMFPLMRQAVDAFLLRMAAVGTQKAIDLEAELSHVTADIMFRALFSQPIDGGDAQQVFAAFTRFQRNAPQFNLKVILASDPERPVPLPEAVRNDARQLRDLIRRLLNQRLELNRSGQRLTDFAQSAIDARDDNGQGFSQEQLVDQLAVFFLAGHETTASALAWTLFMVSQSPQVLGRLRNEIHLVLGDQPFDHAHVKQMPFARNVFREGLRLYPPAAFLTRRALETDTFKKFRITKDSFIVVSPWLVHRHELNWAAPLAFDPDRFADDQPTPRMGTYIPFGLGPRVCTGAMIAHLEAAMIMSELLRRFDLLPLRPDKVFPITRVTIRPREGIPTHLARTNAFAQSRLISQTVR